MSRHAYVFIGTDRPAGAMLDNPAAQVHMRQAVAIAIADQADPHLHAVKSMHHR